MSFRFREHRGGLDESMETQVTLEDGRALVIHCQKLLRPYSFEFEPVDLTVRLYSARPDTRIGWNRTYVVHIQRYGVMGFTDTYLTRREIDGTSGSREESKPPGSDRTD